MDEISRRDLWRGVLVKMNHQNYWNNKISDFSGNWINYYLNFGYIYRRGIHLQNHWRLSSISKLVLFWQKKSGWAYQLQTRRILLQMRMEHTKLSCRIYTLYQQLWFNWSLILFTFPCMCLCRLCVNSFLHCN